MGEGPFTAETRRKPLKHRGKEEAGGTHDIWRKILSPQIAQTSAEANGNFTAETRRRGENPETRRKGGSGGPASPTSARGKFFSGPFRGPKGPFFHPNTAPATPPSLAIRRIPLSLRQKPPETMCLIAHFASAGTQFHRAPTCGRRPASNYRIAKGNENAIQGMQTSCPLCPEGWGTDEDI